jgi:hypothetical protein
MRTSVRSTYGAKRQASASVTGDSGGTRYEGPQIATRRRMSSATVKPLAAAAGPALSASVNSGPAIDFTEYPLPATPLPVKRVNPSYRGRRDTF